jgi:hypothetical protein
MSSVLIVIKLKVNKVKVLNISHLENLTDFILSIKYQSFMLLALQTLYFINCSQS